MGIYAFSGRPGGGKSYGAVERIIEELVYGSRTVVTFENLGLVPGRINEYIQKQYPHKVVDVVNRLVILPDEAYAEFYRYRPRNYVLEGVPKDQEKRGVRPDYSRCYPGGDTGAEAVAASVLGGVLYVLDEVHNVFNSRSWAETGKCILWYLSQHRKLGDDVVWITQHVENVDKQFRSLTQDYTYFRNLSKERLFNFVRMPRRIMRQTYLTPNAAPGARCQEFRIVRVEPDGIGSCYDTSRGIGFHGAGTADKGDLRGGLPWWSLIVLILLGALGIYLTPRVVASYARAQLSQEDSSAGASSRVSVSESVESPPEVVTPRVGVPLEPIVSGPVVGVPVVVGGMFRGPGGSGAIIDGRRVLVGSELQAVDFAGRRVLYRGEWHSMSYAQ